jgi:hypothetical protein
MKKRIFAREWLIFLACLFIGLIVVPYALSVLYSLAFEGETIPEWLGFYELLIGEGGADGALFGYAIVLAPYLIVQLTRSIIWSVKSIRND